MQTFAYAVEVEQQKRFVITCVNMATTKIEVSLQDAETGVIYKILVSEEDAKRLETDLTFATEKLMEQINANKDEITSAEEKRDSNANISDTQNTDEAAQAFKWPHEAIMLLIEEYHVREPDFTSGKISQKKVWENISQVMVNRGYHVTGPQCMSKFAGLKRTYKSVKDHNSKSGNGPRSWPYMSAMDDLLSKKPYMSPLATVSSSGKRSRTESDCSSSTISSDEATVTTPKKPRTSVTDQLLQYRRWAEEANEKRHQENLLLKQSLLKTLDKVVDLLEKKN